ncbi:metallophosphoesterase [Patescibacteria group bacterium]
MNNKVVKRINRFLSNLAKKRLLLALMITSFILIIGTTAFIYFKNKEQGNGAVKYLILEKESEEQESDTSTDPNSTTQSENGDDSGNSDSTGISSDTTSGNGDSDSQSKPEPDPEPEPDPLESPSAVVAFYADNQSDTDEEDVIHQRAVNYILGSGANPIFHAGDLMEDGTQDSLDRFNSVTATLRSTRTFYAALGNNDRKVGDPSTPSQLFLDNFVFPNNEQWYSVNFGNLHMVILDSAFSSGNPSQLSWLASDLQSSASQSRITGVMFHHPTFSSTISQQLIDYGVDFVISGHNHVYQHTTSSGINYFVLSGQTSLGYMVARIYSDRVTTTAYNNNNGVVDTTEFSER